MSFDKNKIIVISLRIDSSQEKEILKIRNNEYFKNNDNSIPSISTYIRECIIVPFIEKKGGD